MRGKRTIAILLLAMMFSVSLSGCLGLVASRELLEWQRGEPTTNEHVDAYRLNHTFVAGETPFHRPQPVIIPFDTEVTEISIFFKVQMDFTDVGGVNTSEFLGEVRYVHARLWEADANKNTDIPYWEENATEDHYPPIQRIFDNFEEGDWELEVTAQGYGLSTPIDGVEFHDSYEVVISVVRPCILFPEREDPNECIPI